MFDFHEKRKIRRILYSKFLIGAIFLIAIVIGRSVYERFTVEREMALKLEERSGELEALKQRANLLEGKVEHLKNERGIEEELRSRFDVVKDGEQVVILIDDVVEEASDVDLKATTTDEKHFFEVLKFW